MKGEGEKRTKRVRSSLVALAIVCGGVASIKRMGRTQTTLLEKLHLDKSHRKKPKGERGEGNLRKESSGYERKEKELRRKFLSYRRRKLKREKSSDGTSIVDC